MENSDELFDLIYLPSVGGYPQMMLEPGNMIRTIEAYKTLSEHLTEQGILAIWYPAVLDPHTTLTEQYIDTHWRARILVCRYAPLETPASS
jgi:hypothetical protein